MEKIRKYVERITDGEIVLSDEQLSQFDMYFHGLIEKNKVMNLTAITEREEVILKHFIDSLAIAECFPSVFREEKTVLDIGTGAGFPGIPLALAFPKLRVTLLDSLNKRVLFLQETAEALGIGVPAIHGRAEDCGTKKEMREHYDLVVSRAVANMAVLAEYGLPFVRQGGYFIPYKTDKISEELEQGKRAISLLGGTVEATKQLTLPDSDIKRSFVLIRKTKPTPKRFPRKAGTASKQPLL